MHNLPFKTMFIHVHVLFHPCTPKACYFRFPLLFHVHPSFFYPFPSFPYFDLGYWPHDNYPSPLLPCTTSPSKQCSSMFMCHSIHAHQKHVTFVFPSYFMSIHPFFIHFPHFHILILVIGHMTTIPPLFCHAQPPLQNNVHPCSSVIPSMHTKSMLVVFFIHFSLLFHVHLSFFCSSMFISYSIDSIFVYSCFVSYNPVGITQQPDFEKHDKSLANKCA